jgi:hypothetical protein
VAHWPDALAFVLGLGVAWWAGWETTDLVWSLWLSSLVVGYAMIVWSIFGPGSLIVRGAWRDRAMLGELPVGKSVAGLAVLAVGGMFLLAFFTFHFGMFHFVHSQFLGFLFPLEGAGTQSGMAGIGTYIEVVRRYWIFLPAAFIAERAAFRLPAPKLSIPPNTALTPEAIARRNRAQALVTGDVVGQVASQTLENMAAINDVVRMPVLRPLVGLDKEEITAEAQRLGTFEISIIPDQDCCTLFTPRHPATKSRRTEVERAESGLPIADIVTEAVNAAVIEQFYFPDRPPKSPAGNGDTQLNAK